MCRVLAFFCKDVEFPVLASGIGGYFFPGGVGVISLWYAGPLLGFSRVRQGLQSGERVVSLRLRLGSA